MSSNYLLFRLCERIFAVPLQTVVEILPWRRTRSVPLSYSFVEGIMDYRGTLFPVFHLPQLLELSRPGPIGFTAPDEQLPKERSIVLLEEAGRSFGISVDSVLKMSVLQDPGDRAPEAKGVNAQLVKDVQYEDDQEIILVSFERLFHAG